MLTIQFSAFSLSLMKLSHLKIMVSFSDVKLIASLVKGVTRSGIAEFLHVECSQFRATPVFP